MQTTLLGLAIAIILALIAALVAPLVVDWNQYRSVLEDKASQLIGLHVRVSGAIEARLLPTPLVKLRAVEIGEAGQPPRLRAGALELEVGLGPLMRGEVRARELHLVAPEFSLGLDRNGHVDWPSMTAAFRPDSLSVSRLNIEDGRLILADAASGARLVLQKLWFNGEIRSFAGPFSGEGAFVLDNELYGYRVSGGRVDDEGGLKLKLGIDPSDRPLTTEADGTLTFSQGVPQFEGTLSLARPVGATLSSGQRVMSDPWHVTSKVRATPASALLQEIEFQFGPEERALKFTGTAELKLGERPRLEGVVSARQVDLDRALAAPDVTRKPPLTMIKSFADSFGSGLRPPIPAQIGIGLEAVTLGGTTIQSLRGDLSFDQNQWSFDRLEFRAPGFTQVGLSGRLSATDQGLAFSGPANIESADLKTLVAWLEGRSEVTAGQAKALRARGDLTLSGDKFAVDRLKAAFDRENVEGRIAYSWAAGDRPATLDADVSAAQLDLDALLAFGEAALGGTGFEPPHDVTLAADIGKATFGGVEAGKVNAKLKFDSGVLQIDRLTVGEVGGAALDVSGRIDELSSRPRGRITLDLDARALAGLSNVVAKVAPQAAEPFRRFADRLAPAKVRAVLSVERATIAGTTAKFGVEGKLGAMRVNLTGEATGDPAAMAAAGVRAEAKFDADDGGALLALLGLDKAIAVGQRAGRMMIAANGPLNGNLRLNGVLAASGLDASVNGTLRLTGEQAPTGALQLKMAAADLRPVVRAMTGQAGEAVPMSALAAVGIAGPKLTFNDLTGAVGKSSVRGRLALVLSNGVGIDGDLDVDNVDAATVLATGLGFPSAAGPWSSEPLKSGAFSALDGAVRFKLARAALSPTLAARDLHGLLRMRQSEIALENMEGTLAGGQIEGDLAFRRNADGLSAHGRIALAAGDTAALLAPGKSSIDGRLTLKLEADGIGLSPRALIGSLHGGGTITLAGGHFAGLDAAAFDAAIQAVDQSRAVDQSGAVDASKVRAVVSASMANSRFAVPRGEAAVTIAGGQLRLSNVTIRSDGGAELALAGVLDCTDGSLDARLTLSGTPGANALINQRPELVVALKGPFSAPNRTVDVSVLTGWLTLRAADQQARRLEAIEANRRDAALAPVVRPPSPAVRFAPSGTVIESPIAGIAPPATGAPGARALDRLKPEAPADDSRPDAGNPDQGVNRLPALPPPAEIKPLFPQPQRAPSRADNTGGVTGDQVTTEPPRRRPVVRQPAPAATERPPLDLLFRPQH